MAWIVCHLPLLTKSDKPQFSPRQLRINIQLIKDISNRWAQGEATPLGIHVWLMAREGQVAAAATWGSFKPM